MISPAMVIGISYGATTEVCNEERSILSNRMYPPHRKEAAKRRADCRNLCSDINRCVLPFSNIQKINTQKKPEPQKNGMTKGEI